MTMEFWREVETAYKERDYKTLIRLLSFKAEQGDADAQARLAGIYFSGRGVAEDLAEAAKWYQKAACQGHAEAQDQLGTMYRWGLGIAIDKVEAVKWYQKAAIQFIVSAQRSLAEMYDEGDGAPQSAAQAASWYGKAADCGDVLSQFRLGIMYSKGRGVVQDYVQAYQWISIAEENHLGPPTHTSAEALQLRNKFAKSMTPDQIVEAQKRVRAWRSIVARDQPI